MVRWSLPVLAALVAVASATSGCSTSPAGGASSSAEPEKPKTASSAPDTQTAPNYVAKLRAAGPFKAGAKGEVRVSVEALGDYHVNDEFKYKFKLDEPASRVTYPSNPVTEVTKTSKDATMAVPFVADAPGTYVVSGTCSLSVCTAGNCVIDKVALSTTVTVE